VQDVFELTQSPSSVVKAMIASAKMAESKRSEQSLQ
jgi:hypothetical protein